MIIFRKPNPKTGSAAVAKDRLMWCMVYDYSANWEAMKRPGMKVLMRWLAERPNARPKA